MNATTAALCAKPGLGLALYFLTLCASNQALHDVFIDLSGAGAIATKQVNVPMDEVYNLILWRVPARANGHYDRGLDFACSRPDAPLSLTLKVSSNDETESKSQNFDATCPPRHGEDPSLLHLGQFRLKKGQFKLVIQNNRPLALPSDGRVEVLLVGTGVSG